MMPIFSDIMRPPDELCEVLLHMHHQYTATSDRLIDSHMQLNTEYTQCTQYYPSIAIITAILT